MVNIDLGSSVQLLEYTAADRKAYKLERIVVELVVEYFGCTMVDKLAYTVGHIVAGLEFGLNEYIGADKKACKLAYKFAVVEE